MKKFGVNTIGGTFTLKQQKIARIAKCVLAKFVEVARSFRAK